MEISVEHKRISILVVFALLVSAVIFFSAFLWLDRSNDKTAPYDLSNKDETAVSQNIEDFVKAVSTRGHQGFTVEDVKMGFYGGITLVEDRHGFISDADALFAGREFLANNSSHRNVSSGGWPDTAEHLQEMTVHDIKVSTEKAFVDTDSTPTVISSVSFTLQQRLTLFPTEMWPADQKEMDLPIVTGTNSQTMTVVSKKVSSGWRILLIEGLDPMSALLLETTPETYPDFTTKNTEPVIVDLPEPEESNDGTGEEELNRKIYESFMKNQ